MRFQFRAPPRQRISWPEWFFSMIGRRAPASLPSRDSIRPGLEIISGIVPRNWSWPGPPENRKADWPAARAPVSVSVFSRVVRPMTCSRPRSPKLALMIETAIVRQNVFFQNFNRRTALSRKLAARASSISFPKIVRSLFGRRRENR